MGVVHNFVNIWINYRPSWNWGTAFIKGLRKKNTYPTLSISYHWAIWTSTLPVRLTSYKQNNKGALCSCSVASPQSNILKTMKINHPNKKLQDQYNSTSSVIECLFHEDNPKMNNLQGSYYLSLWDRVYPKQRHMNLHFNTCNAPKKWASASCFFY